MEGQKGKYRGCLIGGAIGDALGWPVEFKSMEQINATYGPEGITDLDVGIKGVAEITDDTQMTIFTSEGILRAETREKRKGNVDVPSMIYRSYLRWLHTQGIESNIDQDGWILSIKELQFRRAPGNTCLSALRSSKKGSVQEPINNSKGCGGVMRTAPIGLFYSKEEAFKLGCDSAAITHGHPSGFLPAGALSYLIAALKEGLEFEKALQLSLEELKAHPSHEECSILFEKALDLASSDKNAIEAINQLGEGWVGEEALAISLYSALKYKNQFETALAVAVNHNGDSDSTGAITGNILGCHLGMKAIPKAWIENVECSSNIIDLADDLYTRYQDSREWFRKYPGW